MNRVRFSIPCKFFKISKIDTRQNVDQILNQDYTYNFLVNVAEWYTSRSHVEVNPGSIPNSLGIFQKKFLEGKLETTKKLIKLHGDLPP